MAFNPVLSGDKAGFSFSCSGISGTFCIFATVSLEKTIEVKEPLFIYNITFAERLDTENW